MGPALPDPDLADGRSADPAGCALPAVDLDNKTAGLEDTVDIGSPGGNRLAQNSHDGGMQTGNPVRREIRRVGEGMEAGPKETLIGVDIADAGHKGLIQ